MPTLLKDISWYPKGLALISLRGKEQESMLVRCFNGN